MTFITNPRYIDKLAQLNILSLARCLFSHRTEDPNLRPAARFDQYLPRTSVYFSRDFISTTVNNCELNLVTHPLKFPNRLFGNIGFLL